MSASSLRALRAVLCTALGEHDPRVRTADNALALGDDAYCAATLDVLERSIPKPAKVLAAVADRLRAEVREPQQVLVLEAVPGESALPALRHHTPRVSIRWTAEHIEQGSTRIVCPIGAGPGPAQGLAMWWTDGGARTLAASLATARKVLDTGEVTRIEVK